MNFLGKQPLMMLALMVVCGLPHPLPAQSRGDVLDARLQKLTADFHATDNLNKAWLNSTADYDILQHISAQAWQSLHNAEGALSSLNYADANQLMDFASENINNAKFIMADDGSVPRNVLQSENTVEKYLDTIAPTLPTDISDCKKRALIVSEQLLLQKMIARCSELPVPSDFHQTQYWDTPWNAYIETARERLYALEYEKSHQIDYQGYRALAACAPR